MKKLLAAIYLAFTVSLAVSAEYGPKGLSPEEEMLHDYYTFSGFMSDEEMIRQMTNKSYMYCRTLGNHMDRIGALVHASSDIAITDSDALSDYLETINTLTKIADKFHAHCSRFIKP